MIRGLVFHDFTTILIDCISTMWGPVESDSVQLVNITPITVVYGTYKLNDKYNQLLVFIN